MSKEYIFFILIIITPIVFYFLTKITLQKSILYNRRYSILSRFSFYRHLKKNNVGFVLYIEMSELKENVYTDKEESIIRGKLISILKKYSKEYMFSLFCFSDEKFVLVNREKKSNHHQLADRLINNLNKNIKIDNRKIKLKFHIGAVISKSLPTNSEDLLDIVISSCHIAKNRNTNYNLINLDNPNNVEKSYGIDDSNKIISHYLCIYDTKKVKIVGFETLARWKNKDKVLNPNVFIPLAIKRNLISNVDFGIAEDALKNYLKLLNKNLVDENFIIGIKVAKESLSDSFVKRLDNLIRRYKQVPVNNILIHINMVTFKDNDCISNLRKIQDIGFKVCIDNISFSFDELIEIHGKFPYDMIKITTDHYKKPEFSKFIEFLVSKGVQVIVTKIEKVDELHALIKYDLNLVQGFWYGKPREFNRFEEQIWSNNVFGV
ncbi:EAL domain-containing protein [Mycoplasmatota bacterium]|nr:EAL domain-containing protein [Mycoplasmatota bacterium]